MVGDGSLEPLLDLVSRSKTRRGSLETELMGILETELMGILETELMGIPEGSDGLDKTGVPGPRLVDEGDDEGNGILLVLSEVEKVVETVLEKELAVGCRVTVEIAD